MKHDLSFGPIFLTQFKNWKDLGVFIMKLKLEDKLKIIDLYNEGLSTSQISKQFKVSDWIIENIKRQYREYGIESFKEKGKNKKYSPEIKMKIVNRVLNGESKSGIAAELCVNKGMIHNWVKKYKELGYNGLTIKQGRPRKMKDKNKQTKKVNASKELDDKDKRIKELEERNAQLEMENDLLKKLRALVQQRNKQQDEKK